MNLHVPYIGGMIYREWNGAKSFSTGVVQGEKELKSYLNLNVASSKKQKLKLNVLIYNQFCVPRYEQCVRNKFYKAKEFIEERGFWPFFSFFSNLPGCDVSIMCLFRDHYAADFFLHNFIS